MRIKTKIICVILLIITFLIALSIHLDAWGNATSFEESINHIIQTHRIPTCNMALFQNNNTEYFSDSLTGDKLSSDAIFPSSAVTEIMTGLALNLLVEEQKISLDEKITDFYPWLTFTYEEKPVEITIRQLASHSSGISLYSQGCMYGKDSEGLFRASMREISGKALSFMPGSTYRKTDLDYAILAFIIEKATGKTWSEYITENVIRALDLKNTYINEEDKADRAVEISGSRTCAGFIIDYKLPQNSVNLTVRGVKTCVEDIIYLLKYQKQTHFSVVSFSARKMDFFTTVMKWKNTVQASASTQRRRKA